MRLATHGYDEFHAVVGERHRAVAAERADQQVDEIDRSLAAMGRQPTLIALLWLTFYVVIAFAALTG
jgi:hypothetical protein